MTDVCHRLLKATEFARKNLQWAQGNMKTWYDKKARKRKFKPGDKVLVLLPIHGHPLQARYCGPFVVEKRVSDVDYVIKTPGRRKDNRLCHINMLKAYQEREDAAESGSKVVSVVATATPCLHEQSTEVYPVEGAVKGLKLNNSNVLSSLDQKLGHLPESEQKVLKALITEFTSLFPDVPGRTLFTSHAVDVGEAQPIKQHPYRVDPVKLMHICKEVEYMLENRIIEPSPSQWSSPCVIVPKPDGSYRFCTDFR